MLSLAGSEETNNPEIEMTDMLRWAEFAYLCEKELELCALQPGETVIVLSQAADRQD
jgi:hypothetical protein